MANSPTPGRIVILNGAPRSGKSTLARAIQDRFDGVWIGLGVDAAIAMLPARFHPGIGLRPGGERPDIESLVPVLYAALYDSIAAHSRQGVNVVADLCHHDDYSRPLGILPHCARRLDGLPVLFVGLRCPLDVILQRRRQLQEGREDLYLQAGPDDSVPEPVRRWQEAVHHPGIYDLEIDTSLATPEQAADAIRVRLDHPASGPTAFERLAAL